jgi:hypothetical protein
MVQLQDLPTQISLPLCLEMIIPLDYGNADNEHSDAKTETAPNPESGFDNKQLPKGARHTKTTKLQELTKKLDNVIKQITQSASQ